MTKLYFATDRALVSLTLDAEGCRCDWHLNDRKVQCVAVDPRQPQWVFCGTFDSGLCLILSAATSARHSHYDEHPESYIYRRTAGSPWQEIRDGLPDERGRHSAVVAAHFDKAGMFFAAWERDVFRSVDGGATWERLGVSLPDGSRIIEHCALAVVKMD